MAQDMPLWQRLTPLYSEREARAIVQWVLDVRFGLSLTDIVCGRLAELSTSDRNVLDTILTRVAAGEPVQYVVGTAYFCGRPFHVEPGVLIPRPETEALCEWVLASEADHWHEGPHILDVGTGSGCIAITLALGFPKAQVTAVDISPAALSIAQSNAQNLNAPNITFHPLDILNPAVHHPSSIFNLIISNPPYICHRERTTMAPNVLDHEPHEALFVPDDDPLLFYRAIARYAISALTSGGRLYFELNPLYADATVDLLADLGFTDTKVCPDPFGRRRLLQTTRP